MRPGKQPPATLLVIQALRELDDFITLEDLARLAKVSKSNASSALWTLKNYYGAVDCITDPSGTNFWYARPPEEDKRSKYITERKPETQPRRRKTRRQG